MDGMTCIAYKADLLRCRKELEVPNARTRRKRINKK